jgi:hypothetical protein
MPFSEKNKVTLRVKEINVLKLDALDSKEKNTKQFNMVKRCEIKK